MSAQTVPDPRLQAPFGQVAAFFDLDRTLISGSSTAVFGMAAWRAGMVPRMQLVRDALAAASFQLLGDNGGATAGNVRERILGAIEGVERDSLLGLNDVIVPKLLGRVRPESKRLIEMHRRMGRATYIVSASPIELVEPLAKALGMTDGLGTVAEVVDGIYTGRLVGPFCYGEGKVAAITDVARWEGLDLHQCYAYSDSISDLPMLRAVGHPVAVNPDSQLEREARANGWPIVVFSQRTKTVVRRTGAGLGATALAATSFASGWRLAATRRRA
jgi:HAD superfamily hydrolase (TIGR01490 family)